MCIPLCTRQHVHNISVRVARRLEVRMTRGMAIMRVLQDLCLPDRRSRTHTHTHIRIIHNRVHVGNMCKTMDVGCVCVFVCVLAESSMASMAHTAHATRKVATGDRLARFRGAYLPERFACVRKSAASPRVSHRFTSALTSVMRKAVHFLRPCLVSHAYTRQPLHKLTQWR